MIATRRSALAWIERCRRQLADVDREVIADQHLRALARVTATTRKGQR